MAKRGVKNIPLAVDDEDEIKLIEAEFGLKGWATIRKLEQFIGEHGYYVKMDIDTQLLFIREKCLSAVGQSAVSEIIACAIRRGVFNAEKWEKHGILTNTRLQETFLNTYKRSKEIVFDNDYALPVVYNFIETASKNGKSVNILFKNVSKNDTNNIRQDKIRLDKSRSSGTTAILSDGDYDSLCSLISKEETDYYIERVKAFLTKNPDARLSVKATILKWHKEDKAKEKAQAEKDKPVEKSYSSEALNALFDNIPYEDL